VRIGAVESNRARSAPAGERNYRYFLAFLAAHVLLCAYGAWMMFALVAGEVRAAADAGGVSRGRRLTRAQLVRHGIPDAFVTLRGEEVPLRRAPLALLQFAVFSYSPVACLGLFLLLTCILVASFLAYHLSLVASNTTTNEARARALPPPGLTHPLAGLEAQGPAGVAG